MYRKTRLAALTLLAVSSAFAAPTQTAVLDVQNMTCSLCPITVRKALEKVPGVSAVAVDLDHKTATVTFDPASATVPALAQAATNAGFPATLHQ